jgi:hypothetical protein
MEDIKQCPECGVPVLITDQFVWLNSGVVVMKNDMSIRRGFIESGNLDPLYEDIGKIAGKPIDHMVVDIATRGSEEYFSNLVPPEIRGLLIGGILDAKVIVDDLSTTGFTNGFGRYEVLDFHYTGGPGDYLILRIGEPFSVLLCVGSLAGACKALLEKQVDVTYKEVSPGLYELEARWLEQPVQNKKPFTIKKYYHRDGDIELEKCASCGGPKALAAFRWQLDRGIITNTLTGMRMVLIGPHVLDPLFEELEQELGEIVPKAVIDSQRLFVKSGLSSVKDIPIEADFRTQLALRGLGNLVEINMTAKGLRLRIDNAADYLMVVGLAQAIFEIVFDVGSYVEWEISERGDLEVEVTPAG